MKLPPKLKDPGSFTIPCSIGTTTFNRILCDLGASINLMPHSIFLSLGLNDVLKLTNITLQLANCSLTYPKGVIEDMLVKVDKFILPTDFVVLDMEEDKDVPIILGRPFLATGDAMIEVKKGEFTLRVDGEQVVFNVFKAMKYPVENDSCFRIEVVDNLVGEMFEQSCVEDPLGCSLLLGNVDMEEVHEEIKEVVDFLNHSPSWTSPPKPLPLGEHLKLKPSIEELPTLELKPLPVYLKYSFFGESNILSVIIYSSLSLEQEDKLLRVLRECKEAIGWTIADIKGISKNFLR